MGDRLKIFFVSCVVGAGIYFAAFFLIPSKNVPLAFSEARFRGAELASQVVAYADNMLLTLEKISAADQMGKTGEALTLVSGALVENREAQKAALELAEKLENMSRSINEIKPTNARVLATEAVTSEVALVSHLLLYNDYLTQLFQFLDLKFQQKAYGANGRVKDLVEKINNEVREINSLNERFTKSLAEFDKLF